MKYTTFIGCTILTILLIFPGISAGTEHVQPKLKPYQIPPTEQYDDSWKFDRRKAMPRNIKKHKPTDEDISGAALFFKTMHARKIQFIMTGGPRVLVKVFPSQGVDLITVDQVCDLAALYKDFKIEVLQLIRSDGYTIISNCNPITEKGQHKNDRSKTLDI